MASAEAFKEFLNAHETGLVQGTSAWVNARHKSVGVSEVAALSGRSPVENSSSLEPLHSACRLIPRKPVRLSIRKVNKSRPLQDGLRRVSINDRENTGGGSVVFVWEGASVGLLKAAQQKVARRKQGEVSYFVSVPVAFFI